MFSELRRRPPPSPVGTSLEAHLSTRAPGRAVIPRPGGAMRRGAVGSGISLKACPYRTHADYRTHLDRRTRSDAPRSGAPRRLSGTHGLPGALMPACGFPKYRKAECARRLREPRARQLASRDQASPPAFHDQCPCVCLPSIVQIGHHRFSRSPVSATRIAAPPPVSPLSATTRSGRPHARVDAQFGSEFASVSRSSRDHDFRGRQIGEVSQTCQLRSAVAYQVERASLRESNARFTESNAHCGSRTHTAEVGRPLFLFHAFPIFFEDRGA